MGLPYEGDSTSSSQPGLTGKNTAGGVGVEGVSDTWQGVSGHSNSQAGVVGESDGFDGVFGMSHSTPNAGVSGHHDKNGTGVWGDSDGGRGVAGFSNTWQGVYGHSNSQAGVVGESDGFDGVFGMSHSTPNAGVSGHNDKNGTGVWGDSDGGRGVAGFSNTWQGVYGHSNSQAGVVGESDGFDGVFGISHNLNAAGVSGHNPGGLAGFFDGNVTVTGDIFLPGADCAEQFDVSSSVPVDPGSVMSIRDDGSLGVCEVAYDRRVAGVVSGAGDFRPGIVLDQKGPAAQDRSSVALVGKVYCKVDATFAPIETGDLLTTSPTPGCAMKALEPLRAFGAVLGKALRPCREGRGLIPILVALQ